MLSSDRKLFFPSIVYLKAYHQLSNITSLPAGIYCANWDQQENHVCRRTSSLHKIEITLPSLPKQYDDQIKNLKFCLSWDFIAEIQRCAHAAVAEFNIHRKLGSSIKELCLGPGVAYIEISFRLLADAIFDEEEEFYTRDYTLKTIAFHAMLYKFWCYQVPKDKICDYARIYNLAQASRCANKLEPPGDDIETSTKEIARFLDEIRIHQIKLEEQFKQNKIEK